MSNLNGILTVMICMLGLPIIYSISILYYRPNFTREYNQNRKPLKTLPEGAAMLMSEGAILRLWFAFDKCSFHNFQYVMLIVILYGMTILCMTDYWEKVVPNRILLVMLMLWIVFTGMYGIRNTDKILIYMFGVILGLIFCSFSFGLCYLLSRGSMGAGDVKLSLVMALYMTGDYVVGTVFYGCVLCAVCSIGMLITKKVSRKTSIPLVPFLYAGMIVRYLIG